MWIPKQTLAEPWRGQGHLIGNVRIQVAWITPAWSLAPRWRALSAVCQNQRIVLELKLQEQLFQPVSQVSQARQVNQEAAYAGLYGAKGDSAYGVGPPEGDWQCPNSGCVNSRNMVFGSKTSCPRCGTPRPTLGLVKTAGRPQVPQVAQVAQVAQSPAIQYLPLPVTMAPQFGLESLKSFNMAAAAGMMANVNGRPGDWQCPNRECVNHKRMVFAKNDTCPQCGSAKPGRGGANPQDWQCPNTECQNHRNFVFAKHEMCPRCGQSKDASVRSRSRSPKVMGRPLVHWAEWLPV